MNIDDALDTPAAPARQTDWLKSLLIPLLVATLAGSISLAVGARVFQSSSRSTQLKVEAERQAAAQQVIVSQRLTAAYNAFSTITPAGSTIGSLTTDEKKNLEFAMRDVYLFGNQDATNAVDKWFKSNFKSPVEGVLLPLRNQIRSLAGLSPSKQTNSPWIQTFWRTDAAKPKADTPK
jgi:type II secretory pathway pseudopilin PulG